MCEYKLTEQEERFVMKIKRDLEFYDKYKSFMGRVKSLYLQKGPEAAKKYIRDNADMTLTLAIDEMFNDLFTKL